MQTRKAGREHATLHMPVETAKCWWLLKIEPNAWAGGKGNCAVCVDLQAVGTLKFFGELYSLAKGFGPIFKGFGQTLEKGRVLHFLVTTSTSPSLQAYAELHALSGSISPCQCTGHAASRICTDRQLSHNISCEFPLMLNQEN